MTSRRRILSASAAAIGGGFVTAVTISSTAQQASAATADLDIGGDEVTVRNEEIEAVRLEATVAWSYAVDSAESPETVEVELLAGDELAVVASASGEEVFLEADGEESFNVDLLSERVVSAEELRPDSGGETVETTVPVGVEFRLLDESGAPIATDSDETEATIAVTQDDYDPSEYGDVSGSGELTVEIA